jgi:hypothetical protein
MAVKGAPLGQALVMKKKVFKHRQRLVPILLTIYINDNKLECLFLTSLFCLQ